MNDATSFTHYWTARLVGMISVNVGVPPEVIATDVPLSRYGMDSLAQVQLAQEISDAVGTNFPDSLLYEEPTIARLVARLELASTSLREGAVSRTSSLQTMLSDSTLPADICPREAVPVESAETILLTGATGFLGAHVLYELLKQSDARVVCVVRASSVAEGTERVSRALHEHDLWRPTDRARIEVVAGDIALPRLGLTRGAFAALAMRVDAIYHVAANVNWVVDYEALRADNVFATIELLRLAALHRRKAFHFVSSTVVCHAIGRAERFSESDDLSELLGDLPLGYAQSKAVAERLVLEAATRGLRATITRPTFVSGHSDTGRTALDDFVSRLLRGCVQLGAAPDLDWTIDCCPVNHCARAIVRLTSSGHAPGDIFHLTNPRPQHWRKAVLWMNLYGYDIALLPYAQWRELVRRETHRLDHPLRPLRSFFIGSPPGQGGRSLPELYQEEACSSVCGEKTQQRLEGLGLRCPPLNALLLERYFFFFRNEKAAPEPMRALTRLRAEAQEVDELVMDARTIRALDGTEFELEGVTRLESVSGNSIISELSSWRQASPAGLYRARLALQPEGTTGCAKEIDVFVKLKASDDTVLDVGQSVAALCGDQVDEAFSALRAHLPLTNSHVREIELYRAAMQWFPRYLPHVHAIVRDDVSAHWMLLLEYLPDLVGLDGDDSDWGVERVTVAIEGIAQIHAVWLGREGELEALDWLLPLPSAETFNELVGALSALATFCGPSFERWAGRGIRRAQETLLEHQSSWRRWLEEGPMTLVHNDFNPRNVGLRQEPEGPRLCAFDWEFATIGAPQRDLAEFLCFTLKPDVSGETVLRYLDTHRRAIERTLGSALDAEVWTRGFRAALYDLLLNRFALYAVAHRVQEQRFLPRVIQTWFALYRLFPFQGASHARV